MVLFDLGREMAPPWSALAAVMVLLVLLVVLWFSMRRHLRRSAKFANEDGVDIHAPRMDERPRR